ncbi:hypothetical protein AP220_27565, partial [Escherichia coli]
VDTAGFCYLYRPGFFGGGGGGGDGAPRFFFLFSVFFFCPHPRAPPGFVCAKTHPICPPAGGAFVFCVGGWGGGGWPGKKGMRRSGGI